MKKCLIFVLLFSAIVFFSGFKKYTKPVIVLSAGTITNESIKRPERTFAAGQKINIGLFAPDGFKDNGIRLQLSKQDEKTSNWGFSIIQSRDIYIDKSQKLYKDYIYVYLPGHYILQFFNLSKKTYPFAHFEFLVK